MTLEDYLAKVNSPDWRWPVLVPKVYCPVLDRIHPIKQIEVNVIYNRMFDYPTVRRVTIFGSAITRFCDNCSDLDIYLETDGDYFSAYETISDICEGNCDIVVDDVAAGLLLDNIRKGVVIYERLL